MSKKYFVFTLFVIFTIYLISCNSQVPKNTELEIEKDKVDSVIRDIPKNVNGKTPFYYSVKDDFQNKIGLKTLEKGFDSMQIRIYYGISLAYEGQLVVLTKKKSFWNAEIYFLKYHYNNNGDSLLSVSSEIKQVEPKSGWMPFTEKLFKLQILDLRDAVEISNYQGCNDGDGITIEFATKNKYRIYNYPCFNSQDSSIWQARNVELILELLENDFDFKRVALH